MGEGERGRERKELSEAGAQKKERLGEGERER